MDELQQLRTQLSTLDVELLEMVAKRQQIVAEIGRVKSSAGRGTRDYAREKVVIDLARETAARVGLDAATGEEMFRFLIRISLAAQEQDKMQAADAGDGRRVLVVGGSGNMGQWFVRFLSSQGFSVTVCDPRGALPGYPHVDTLATHKLDYELILLATPVQETVILLDQLVRLKPTGTVFDISSVKGPLILGLRALQAAGVPVASIHPLFGPDVELLSGRNVIFLDLGDRAAEARVRSLFSSTMAEQGTMSLEAHDRVMAYVLGLSHAVNIAFFKALAESHEDAEVLSHLSSTTFDAQLDIARHVATENPFLYYEIQSLNAYSPEAIQALQRGVAGLAQRVTAKDRAGFVELMAEGKRFLEGRPDNRP